jgi:RNA polymerase primary sigma factor/RNA polymerase sigma factor
MLDRRQGGEKVGELAARYGYSKAQVSRILARERYRRVQELPLEFIPNERFARMRRKEEMMVLGPTPPAERPAKRVAQPAGLPPYLANMYETPLLTREQEVHLFRKMNYLKFKASKLRDRLDSVRPSVAVMEEIQRLYDESVVVKNDIVRANLRLVVSIAKRHATGPGHLFELISDGNMSLFRAVEKFDFGRGFRLSTYATWAIMKNFARTIPTEFRHQTRFRTGGDETLDAVRDIHTNGPKQELDQAEREREVAKVLQYLDEREKQIIRFRFGLGHDQKPMTLKEVGSVMGVTKERIRQIEARAMAKLRDAAGEERIESPGEE